MSRDTDLEPRAVPCRQAPTAKDPTHVSCAPEPYVSPLVWDGADKSFFRPLSRALAVETSSEAENADSFDEVADSAWFTNRLGVRTPPLDELLRGACSEKERLDGSSVAPGGWLIDQGKANGASYGFRIVVPDGRKFLLKTDSRAQPERPSAASVIGAVLYHAVGFFTSCEQIVFVPRSALRLKPGLMYENNSGLRRPFDDMALASVFAEATVRGAQYRFQASAWLPGYLIGPFKYEGTRDDDPADVIAHQDRRELRGGRLLAAWLDHVDAREQNSMDIWFSSGGAPDASPGHVRHYYLDTSDCLGTWWAWDAITRRLGHSYLLDFGDIARDFVTLGIPTRPWDRVAVTPGQEIFGYYDVANFDPEAWKMQYPNPAFSRMTERDGAWMARILARLTPEMIDAVAALGRFENPANTKYVAQVLRGRWWKILERYLTRLSPLADVHVVAAEPGQPDRLCAVNLAELRGLRAADAFRYRAVREGGDALEVTRGPAGNVCVSLPPRDDRELARATETAPLRFRVSIEDRVAGPLVAHVYALGAARGYAVAGVERGVPGAALAQHQ